VGFTFRSGYVPGQSLLDPDVEFPQLVLKQAEFAHNLAAMDAFCAARGVSLAPHAKTSMAPALIRRQLDAGAWGVTVATMSQLRVCLEAGVPNIIYAHELVNPAAAAWLGQTLAARRGQRVYCLADSAAGADLMARGWGSSGNPDPLPVLLEIGAAGGRTGCRTAADVHAVAEAVAGHGELCLSGVEAFEGILGAGRTDAELARVDQFLRHVTACAERLDRDGLLTRSAEILLSAGGSFYFDRVAGIFRGASLSRPPRVVLRSGCYAFHDHGDRAGAPVPSGADGRTELIPALELWSEVVSVPEPGLAFAGFGRREAPYDAALPVVLGRLASPDGTLEPLPGVTVTALNDQHAYLSTGPGVSLAVGDRIACGIVHPCTAFDKWRHLALVDERYRVLETIDTYF
jgi:D-serine deaminase-like pyridoxal phosphate-dependent protein